MAAHREVTPTEIVVYVVIAALVGGSVAAMIASGDTPAYLPSDYQILETRHGVFLLDKKSGDTWRWSISQASPGKPRSAGWKHYKTPYPKVLSLEETEALLFPTEGE